jgi:hypothetical protein
MEIQMESQFGFVNFVEANLGKLNRKLTLELGVFCLAYRWQGLTCAVPRAPLSHFPAQDGVRPRGPPGTLDSVPWAALLVDAGSILGPSSYEYSYSTVPGTVEISPRTERALPQEAIRTVWPCTLLGPVAVTQKVESCSRRADLQGCGLWAVGRWLVSIPPRCQTGIPWLWFAMPSYTGTWPSGRPLTTAKGEPGQWRARFYFYLRSCRTQQARSYFASNPLDVCSS